MDDYQLSSIVSSEIEDSLNHFDSEYTQERLRAIDFYLGEPLGNEQAGKSSVVDTTFADTVETIMPNLMRVFTSNDQYVRFAPRTAEDVKGAEQATDMANFVINHDNAGYKVLHTWFKDALMFRLGVVKYFWDETEEVNEEEYNGLSEDELVMLLNDPDVDVVSQEETVTETMMADDGTLVPLASTYDLSVKVTRRSGKIKIINVPPEEFLVSRRAESLEDAHFVAHRTTMTVSDLVAMGYDQEEVEAHASSGDLDVDRERVSRFQDLEAATGTDPADPALREVLYYECIMNIDFDGDGIAERRRICAIGDGGSHILHNEPFDHIPFAVVTPIMMPHRLIGRSIYDMTEDLQVIKTTLMRQYLDSVYSSSMPRVAAVEGQVNLDDLLSASPGGVIRVRQPGMLQSISGAPVGGEIRPLMDYVDSIKENRTGISAASQGLSPDALQSTTASAVAATVRGAQVKMESIARTFAETGMKSLFKGILHLLTKYDNKPRTIRLRNNFVPINPAEWDSEFDVVVQVGLGTTDDETKIAFLTQIAAKQEQIMMQLGPNNPIVSMPQYVSTLRSIAEIGGFKDADQFFNSPEMIQQQMMMQQQQPAGPDPEIVKLEQEMALKRERMQMEIQLAREKMQLEVELRRQELQAEAELRVAKAVTDAEISTNLPRV
ncbi:MAG: portal protein [Luminiphilus sp.]